MDNLKSSVTDRMRDCHDSHGGWIFEEWAKDIGPMSIDDAADYIVDEEWDKQFWDDLDDLGINSKNIDNVNEVKRLFMDNPELEFVIACRLYRREQKNPRRVVKTWNTAMNYNGETHGIIFTGLFKDEEYEFLDELMNDLDNDFSWDT